LYAVGVEILTTIPRASYDFLSGSSLAAAYVSGVPALMLQYQPGLNPDAVKSVLKRTSRPKASQPFQGQATFCID